MIGAPRVEETDTLLAQGVEGLLAEFNQAGVLGVADVRTALAISRIGHEGDDRVRLALGLVVRALRNGSVCVDLATVHATVFDESEAGIDRSVLPWPEPTGWLAACRVSPLVTDGGDAAGGRPLRLANGLLYLERYWQQEELVRRQLSARISATPPQVDGDRLAAALDRLFGPTDAADADRQRSQREAAAASATGWLTVIAGGPGTGKTTTVARVLALLADQPGPAPRVALAAPTGKAAARLEEAVRQAMAQLSDADRTRVGDLSASTLHRLLGWLPGSRSRFRHDSANQLPHDVVVVDEMSMVSLTLTARLLEAVRPGARLILVGDPDQLSSVEAGAVLADIVRAAGWGSMEPADEAPRRVAALTHTWRFGGGIQDLARAIRDADADAAIAVLRSGTDDVGFDESDLERSGAELLPALVQPVVAGAEATRAAALSANELGALAALDRHRLLCAHRRGPYGVQRWSWEVERWLAEALPGYAEDGEWYLGRPLLVTANDYDLGLYNGDTGVVVAGPDGPRAVFARGAAAKAYAPVRLDAVQTVHAMTVHRAQGSQFETVSLIVPPADSPLLTRELLYTAITRATRRVQVFGTEAAIRRAIARPANRASGLQDRLLTS